MKILIFDNEFYSSFSKSYYDKIIEIT